MTEKSLVSQWGVVRRIWPIVITQVCTSAAVGLNLTIAALAAVEVTGREGLGGLAQTSTIIGATVITMAATRLTARTDRLFSLRCTIVLAVLGSLICCAAIVFRDKVGWLLFVGLFLLGGGTVSALISRFVAAEKVGPNQQASSAIATVLLGSALGSLVGPNIYGLISLLTTFPMHFTFIGSAIVFSLGLIPLSLETRKSYILSSPRVSTSRPGKRVEWKPEYSTVFFIAVLSHSSMVSLMTMAPIFTDREFGPSGSGLVMTAHLLGMYAFGPMVSFSLNRIGSKFTVLIGGVTLVASVCTLILFHSTLAFFVIGLFGVGLAWSVGMITSSSTVSNVPDATVRVALQGRLDVTINIAAGVSSICSGIVVAAVGYPNLAIGILVAVCTASLALGGFRLFRRKQGAAVE